MTAERVGDDQIRIPVRVESNGGAIGDGVEVIGPDDPRYPQWDAWLTRQETPPTTPEPAAS